MRDKNIAGNNNPNWKGGISKNYYYYKKIQQQRYPERVRARRLLLLAVKLGKIIPQCCVECGRKDAQAHHFDYSKPLDVVWVCSCCHRKMHPAPNKHLVSRNKLSKKTHKRKAHRKRKLTIRQRVALRLRGVGTK